MNKYFIALINLIIVGIILYFGNKIYALIYLLGTLVGTFFGASVQKEEESQHIVHPKINNNLEEIE